MKIKQKKCKQCRTLFKPRNTLQTCCSWICAIKYAREKKKIKHQKLVDYLKPEKQVKKADALFQKAGKLLYPKSIISGKSTEVIHHRIYKSQSNNLRYDFDNAIPLTVKEHDQLHNRKSGSLVLAQIDAVKGTKWLDNLIKKSRIIRKFTPEYIEKIIKKLNEDS